MKNEERFNLVVICLDTFRFDFLKGKFDYVKTPNINRLAKDSVFFEEAYGEGLPTVQARRTFFTGIRTIPWRFNPEWKGLWPGMSGWHKIPESHATISEILLNRGYMTGLVSDTYHIFKPTMNFTRGFVNYDFIRGQEVDNWKPGDPNEVKEELKKSLPADLKLEEIPKNKKYRMVQYLLNTKDFDKEEDYFPAQVFSTATDWLEANVDNEPFFLWVDSFDPHEPWDPPKKYSNMYHSWDGIRDIEYWAQEYRDLTDEEIKRIKALYFGEVTLVDRWTGHFLKKMEELDLMNDTIIILVSDHGSQIMDHGKFGKSEKDLFPYNTQIAWMIRHPEGPRGKSIDKFVQPQDLLPTSLNLLDIPYRNLDGESVWPLVTGEKEKIRDQVIIGWGAMYLEENDLVSGTARGRVSVRDKNWNYVTEVYSEDNEIEEHLYSVQNGEKERKDVLNENPKIAKKKKKEVKSILQQEIPAELPEDKREALPPIAKYSKMAENENWEKILKEIASQE